MQEQDLKDDFSKELDITEEEIESYSGCSSRTQLCMTDCPWPFPGAYISEGSRLKNRISYLRKIANTVF